MPIYERRKTRQIHIGAIPIGGGAPISVQSMCNTKTTDTEATVQQIRELAAAGCDIVRLAVPDMEAAKNLGNIIRQVKTPLVADIHFDYKLALEAMAQGISALRINPGNIGGTGRRHARAGFPSALALMQGRSIIRSSRNTAALRRRRSSLPRWSTYVCSKSWISTI